MPTGALAEPQLLQFETLEADKDALTPALIWEQWGEASGLSQEHFFAACDDAEVRYIDLPYHNFQHALDVLWGSMELADYCEQNGLALNRRVLIVAALFHDADYHLPLKDGYPSKEARSTTLFANNASRYGLNDDESALGQKIIMDTKLGMKPDTNEGKALVRADLGNVWGEYRSSFLQKTRLLLAETRYLKAQEGLKLSAWEFLDSSLKVLCTYIYNDLSFGKFDKYWSHPARINLTHLVADVAKELEIQPASYIKRLGNTAVDAVVGRSSKLGNRRSES